MKRVGLLFGEITAATREFLGALAQSDRHRDWEGEGFSSCGEWLAWQIGITRNTWGTEPGWRWDRDISWDIEAAALEVLDLPDEPAA